MQITLLHPAQSFISRDILNFLFCSFSSATLRFVNITTEAEDNISTLKPTRKL